MSRDEVSNSASQRYPMLMVHCFALLKRQLVEQNFFQCHPEVILHGFIELLPRLSFCLDDRQGSIPLCQPVQISCLRSPTLTTGVPKKFRGLPQHQVPATLWLQPQSAASTMEARLMIHSDSMSTVSPGMSVRGGS